MNGDQCSISSEYRKSGHSLDSKTDAALEKSGEYRTSVVSDATAIKLDDPNSGKFYEYHAWWLWANDPVHSIHPSTGQRLRNIGQFPGWTVKDTTVVEYGADSVEPTVHPKPPFKSFHPTGNIYTAINNEQHRESECASRSENSRKMVRVAWNSPDGLSDDTYFDIEWLISCSYDGATRISRYETSRVTKSILTRSTSNQVCSNIPQFDYHQLFGKHEHEQIPDQDTAFHILDAVMERGASLLTNVANTDLVDDDNSPVAKVGRTLSGGTLSHGALYGDVFHVRTEEGPAKNIAYTSVALSPHQDLVYYESKPFLQLLHCVSQSSNGGESILVDAMAAAEELRKIAPYLFDILLRCPATFVKQRSGADMCRVQPHICLAPGAGPSAPVTAVHWAPPFEGPLLCVSPEDADEYRIAYGAFERMLDDAVPPDRRVPGLDPALEDALRAYAREHTWEYQMRPGDMLVFNNQRMVHGRRSFEMTPGGWKRHLMGCYTNSDETVSNYRVLLRERPEKHRERNMKNTGRGTIEIS